MANQNDLLRDLCEKTHSMKHLENILKHLYDKQSNLECTVHDLQLSNAKEQADVKRLEGETLAAYFYVLIGKIEERLTIERTQALAVQAKLELAEHELQEVRKKISLHEAELESLTGCDEQYAALLKEKEDAVKESYNPMASEILRLEEEIAAAEHRLKEVCEALDAGDGAKESVRSVLDKLKKAEVWGAYDIAGGGLVSGLMKHSHLQRAQKELWYMRQKIEDFRTEISDVDIHADLLVNIGGFSQFIDVFIDDIFSDLYTLDLIQSSKSQLRHVIEQIKDVIRKLQESKKNLEKEIEELAEEHDKLLVNIEI